MLVKAGQEKWVQQLYLHTKAMGIVLNFLAGLGVFVLFFLLQADNHLSWQCKQCEFWTSYYC